MCIAPAKSEPLLMAKPSRMLVYIAFIFPALAGFLFGYDIGAASGAVDAISDYTEVTSLMKSLLTSSSLIGATIGSVAVFWAGEPLGRRRELILGSCLYLIGSLITVVPAKSFALAFALTGRIVYGFGYAFSMHAAPVYISEMAPADVRGRLVSAKEGFIVLGILMGFTVSALCDVAVDAAVKWRIVWGVPILVSVAIISGMLAMPPSPRWLLLKSVRNLATGSVHRAAAVAALARFRGGAAADDVEAEVVEIERSLEDDSGAGWEDLFKARRALVAGLGLISLQQLTGQPSVLYYQTAIFKAAGFGSFSSSAAVIVGAAKLLATLFTVRFVDRFGRRPLLFAGISMMLAALAVLGVGFFLADSHGDELTLPEGWPPVIIFALVLYVCGYQVGFGPIAWLIISEVFPLNCRTRALSAAVTVNFGFNLLMTFTLTPLQSAFDQLQPGKGQSYLFFLYALLSAVSMFFVYTSVPETKGKSLEEIQALLAPRHQPRRDLEASGDLTASASATY